MATTYYLIRLDGVASGDAALYLGGKPHAVVTAREAHGLDRSELLREIRATSRRQAIEIARGGRG